MSDKNHGNPVATYIITALILAVITYIEFAIVEYEIAWLSRGAILFWLIALSVVKFFMVVAIFMHLKDDEKTYTGFFSSGMMLALGTFLVLPLLFTVASIPQPIAQAAETAAHGEPADDHDEHEEPADPTAELADPPPLDRSQAIQPPADEDGAEPETQPETVGPDAQQDDQGGLTTAEADETEEPTGAPEDAEEETDEVPELVERADPEVVLEEPQLGAEETAGAPDVATEFDRQAGETTYNQNCQSCHGATGGGIPSVFPPLADNMPQLYNADGGREYLIDVLLNGLQGQIEVLGQTYNGVMPPWPQLSDEDIAAVLNHELTAWGNEEQLNDFSPITAQDVAERRGTEAGDLNERRRALLGQ